ncbi:sensor histidine kinase [Paenibacillus paeoniae]|uniref:histidine kinase n=2 Tax=Paenibacillus paeoniae TaxID=2292705 RepID=A0A371P664_9BACL|nr:sensor histidine kinase [Paenibacillus paeoniae]
MKNISTRRGWSEVLIMGETRGFIYKVAIVVVLLSFLVPVAQLRAEGNERMNTITEWQMFWEQSGKEMTIEQVSALSDDDGWFPVKVGGEYPVVPEEIKTVWIKFQLPELTQMRPAIEFNRLFATSITIYIEQNIVYQLTRDYPYDLNEFFVPLSNSETKKEVYLKLIRDNYRIGLQDVINIGESSELIKRYVKEDLIAVILGAALIFISFFMLVSVVFFNRSFVPGWNSLFLVMLSIGLMILTYSSFIDKIFPEYGRVLYYIFDVASSILIPSIFFFFDKIFGKGPYNIVRYFRNLQMVSAIFLIALLIGSANSEFIARLYENVGLIIFAISIVVGNIILIVSLFLYCKRGNKEAIILASGFSIFAGVGIAEVIWYFLSDQMHMMFFWKVSLLFFLASLIIILVRKVMQNYEEAVKYSKQIEIFNNELQRSEKIEMISHLAASIAHEVRNPLQVTRGFLQLIGQKSSGEKEKAYTTLAINELDRASEIITDFLTFAKPDLGDMRTLNLTDELQQITAILAPLATMGGGTLKISSQNDLFIDGNSSKFKQALINIIKNSIEAFNRDAGLVEISANYEVQENMIIIVIKDNGEGIDEADLKRLGEPYYSKKTKGTGLGLMVTYRIIEAMKGTIQFSSTKGQGTECKIKLPRIIKAD